MVNCFACGKSCHEPAGYITTRGYPICATCFPVICQKYEWEPDSNAMVKVTSRKLPHLGRISEGEVAWHLQGYLRAIPKLPEKTSSSSARVLRELVSLWNTEAMHSLDPQ